MPATPRKRTPAKKAPAKAGKNAAEAALEDATDADLTVTFRKEKFTVPRERLSSARFRLYFAAGRGDDLLLEMLGHDDRTAQDRFIGLLTEGESLPDIAAEFFEAVNAAAGVGNS